MSNGQNANTVNLIIGLLNSTARLAAEAQVNHQKAIELAQAANISIEQIHDATARYTQPLVDPLASEQPMTADDENGNGNMDEVDEGEGVGP